MAGTTCAAMTAVSKQSEIPETEDMTNRRSTPPIEAIEATLEPPEDDARPASVRAATVVITAKDVQAVNRRVNSVIEEVGLPQGVALDTGGVFADIAESFQQMGIAMATGVVLVYAVMVVSQRSLVTR